MASIILTSITFNIAPKTNQVANLKYRLTSDPDLAVNYIDLGDHLIDTAGNLITPITIDGLIPDTSYTVWASILCSNSQVVKTFTTLFTPCGVNNNFSGTGVFYPKTFQITLGSDTGPFLFYYAAGPAPDKFKVRIAGVEVFDSGYVGDPGHFQGQINTALADMGLPPETVIDSDGALNSLGGVGNGNGGIVLNKTTTDPYVFVDIYAVLGQTNFAVNVGCPNGVYYFTDRSGDFTKSDCTPPQVGVPITYTKRYFSYVSQVQADARAAGDTIFDQRGQDYADANGTCEDV